MLELSKTVSKKQKGQSKQFDLKEFGTVASNFIADSDAFININHGAIRSSKTIATTCKWIQFVGASPHDEFLQSGKTRRSLTRNVLNDEMAMLDTIGIDYVHSKYEGTLTIENKTIWLVGFIDERISDVIRGMTIAGWYADEVNTYPKSAVEEALDRMSLEGSQAFWTMNPDSPYHYINTDYITNEGKLANGDVKTWHYTIYDNPNLSKEYIHRTERRYPKGTVGYKRKILGLAVIAEGVIYDRFIESQHTFDDETIPYKNYDKYVISCDWGGGNVTVFGLFGIKYNLNTGNEYHLLDEFYYDISQHNGHGLEVPEAADHAMALLTQNGVQLPLDAFYTPHDAASLRNTLRKRYWLGKPLPVKTYTPDTLQAIEDIKPIISEGRFKIHTKCENSISQAQTYSWDPKAQANGEDRPLKINDHCPDMWRGAILGTRNIGLGSGYTKSKYSYTYSKQGKGRRLRG